jgi:nitrile hydratase subunit beta
MTWRFEIGDPVRARAAKPTGHCRTPFYLRGKRGVVVRRLGEFPNPEELSSITARDCRRSYFIRWNSHTTSCGAPGSEGRGTRIAADLYQHWLEAGRGAA